MRLLEELNQEEHEASEGDKRRAELRELTERIHRAYKDIWAMSFHPTLEARTNKLKEERLGVVEVRECSRNLAYYYYFFCYILFKRC